MLSSVLCAGVRLMPIMRHVAEVPILPVRARRWLQPFVLHCRIISTFEAVEGGGGAVWLRDLHEARPLASDP